MSNPCRSISSELSVGIIGMGHVGTRIAAAIRVACDVVAYDVKTGEPYPEEELQRCNLVMVCVDTPSLPDGQTDISKVERALLRVPGEHVLLRSTVPPGTTDTLAKTTGKTICFSPEYIGESKFAGDDWKHLEQRAPFMVIGGPPGHRGYFIDVLTRIYGPNMRFFQCSPKEAELVKYMENSYLAMKVVFVNEFRSLSEKMGVDWHSVREAWLLDPRINRDHTAAFSDQRGYHGRCLPKDVAGILEYTRRISACMPLLEAVHETNQRRMNGAD